MFASALIVAPVSGGVPEANFPSSTLFRMKMTSQAGDKYVFAHFMMGNTYPYKPENFLKDIRDAVNTGVDGFALNLGQDEWTSSRVETFFSVARDFPSFKLFFSFDMSIIKEPNVIVEYILQYVNHPNSFHYRGRYFVSTFAGENESFGHGDINTGWDVEIKQRLKQNGVEIHFVPSWTGYDAWNMFRRFPVVDGAFSWAAWSIFFLFSADRRPYPDHDTPTKYDTAYRVTAREYGKTYMAGVSPCFFAHFPWKNWVYPDLTLLVRRFREIIKTQADLIQIISWNGNISTHDIVEIDWGESHYIGTLQKEAGIPEGAEKWITGFNHEPWRDICRWFIQAYKFGRYPEVTVNLPLRKLMEERSTDLLVSASSQLS